MQNFSLYKVVFLLAIGLFYAPQAALAEDFTGEQKKQIESIIEGYIKSNPGIVSQALELHRIQLEQEEQETAQKAVLENIGSLTDANLPSVGKSDAAVSVVEFFDYNCGYCKQALADIKEIVKQNDNVRFVLLDLPILGPSSLLAAQYALAAHEQGRYFDYHVAAMEDRNPKDAENLEKIGKDLGLDVEKLKKDAESEKIKERLAHNQRLATAMRISGTPAFIVDQKLERGYIGKDGMIAEIKAAEKAKKSEKK